MVQRFEPYYGSDVNTPRIQKHQSGTYVRYSDYAALEQRAASAPITADAIFEAIKHGDEQHQQWLYEKLREILPAAPALSDAMIDQHLDAVLRAAGSALRHYTMPKSLADMRAAMRAAMA